MKKSWMKKTGLVIVSGMLAAALTACSGESSKVEAPSGKPDSAGKKVVTVSVLQADSFLKAAKQAFEQVHPDIEIEFREYAATSDGGGGIQIADPAVVEKFVNTVGTEVLSGKGADIIELSKLPITKYAAKKALADLGELMENDDSFDKASLYGNILDATKTNGQLFAMPLGFSLKMMLGDKSALEEAGVSFDDRTWNWDQFADVAKQLVKDADGDGKPDKYAITSTPPESLLVNLIGDHYSQFVDSEKQQAHFDSEQFNRLLKQVKRLYDEQLVSADSTSWGEQYFSPWQANTPEDLALFPKVAYGEGGAVYRKPGMGDGITFKSDTLLGINARSDKKQEAWAFIKFLLSEEMQSSPEFKGFPMLKAAFDKVLDHTQEQLKQGTTQLINGFVPEPLTEKELQTLKAIVEDASSYTKSDSKINSIVFEEAPAYFAGQKSAEEVRKLIQNRVTTYLNE